ncbi:unnamed protein product [Heligmosomoides polygyrus]|uniref:Proteasome assembly chaperone 2 n=1 Tax=Heligmosomoides polygyrus TaxID=6339 RepID=A0A183FLU0_HELPZ|nr:unnamed protein product [Heligmosomoides polygyrus]
MYLYEYPMKHDRLDSLPLSNVSVAFSQLTAALTHGSKVGYIDIVTVSPVTDAEDGDANSSPSHEQARPIFSFGPVKPGLEKAVVLLLLTRIIPSTMVQIPQLLYYEKELFDSY